MQSLVLRTVWARVLETRINDDHLGLRPSSAAGAIGLKSTFYCA
jgi:hypothetical protein